MPSGEEQLEGEASEGTSLPEKQREEGSAANQSQLRVLRFRLSALGREVLVLRGEVAELRSSLEAGPGGLEALGAGEQRRGLAQEEFAEPSAVQAGQGGVPHLEMHPGCARELEELRSLVDEMRQHQAPELGAEAARLAGAAGSPPALRARPRGLERGLGEEPAALDTLRTEHEKLAKTVDSGMQWMMREVRSANNRLEEVQSKDSQRQLQHDSLNAEFRALEKCMQQERLAGEELHRDIQESVKRHFAYEQVERGLRASSSRERLERLEGALGLGGAAAEVGGGEGGGREGPLRRLEERVAGCERAAGAADARFAWAKERLEGLQGLWQSLGQELRSVAAGQSRQDAEFEAHSTWVMGRLACLEDKASDSAREHGEGLRQACQRLDQLQADVMAKSCSQARLRSLEQVVQGYLEGVMGRAAGKDAGAGIPAVDHGAGLALPARGRRLAAEAWPADSLASCNGNW